MKHLVDETPRTPLDRVQTLRSRNLFLLGVMGLMGLGRFGTSSAFRNVELGVFPEVDGPSSDTSIARFATYRFCRTFERCRAKEAPLGKLGGRPARFTVYRTVLPDVVTRTPIVGLFGTLARIHGTRRADAHRNGDGHGDEAGAHVPFPSTELVLSVRVTTHRPLIFTCASRDQRPSDERERPQRLPGRPGCGGRHGDVAS